MIHSDPVSDSTLTLRSHFSTAMILVGTGTRVGTSPTYHLDLKYELHYPDQRLKHRRLPTLPS